MALRETAAFVAVWGAIGAGIGIAAEQDTNSTSRARIVTIDTCKEIYPRAETIGKQLLSCLEDGVPNGAGVGPSLDKNDPIEFVDALRASQVDEANSGDWGNVILYGAGGLAVGAFFFGGPSAFKTRQRRS